MFTAHWGHGSTVSRGRRAPSAGGFSLAATTRTREARATRALMRRAAINRGSTRAVSAVLIIAFIRRCAFANRMLEGAGVGVELQLAVYLHDLLNAGLFHQG